LAIVIEFKRYKRYDLREVAQMLEVEPDTVARWIEHGMLPALRVGSRYLVRGADLFLLGEVSKPKASVEIDLDRSQFNAPGNDNENLRQQYVYIQNQGPSPVDMMGWHLQDRTGATYTFPHFTLHPEGSVRVRTGEGTDTDTDLYWGLRSSVWCNQGDTVSLFDRLWNLVDQKSYGESAPVRA
jgi:excisionase family DNA binding protein